MKSKEFTELHISIKVTNYAIDDIMKKALNGGILHWCLDFSAKYKCNIPIYKIISNNGRLLLHCINNNIYELSKDKLMIGLQQAMPYLERSINGGYLETSLINSDGADLIVQLSLFNELIFD